MQYLFQANLICDEPHENHSSRRYNNTIKKIQGSNPGSSSLNSANRLFGLPLATDPFVSVSVKAFGFLSLYVSPVCNGHLFAVYPVSKISSGVAP